MTLGEAFPLTRGLDDEVIDWGLPFDWAMPDLELLEALWTLQVLKMEDVGRFWEWTEAMVADLATARASMTTEQQTDPVDCARFITSIPALRITISAGQMGAAYDWIWLAIAHTHVRGQRVNQNVFSFLVFPYAPRPLLLLYQAYVPDFAAAVFYTAYKFGGLDQLSADIADIAWAFSVRANRLDPQDQAPVEALVQMTIWAAYRDWPAGQQWADHLVTLLARTPFVRQRTTIAFAFITPAFRYTDMSARERADWMLETLAGTLVEHERLQLLAVSLEGPQDWAAKREAIIEEIARLRALYVDLVDEGQSSLEALEHRVSIIQPLVSSLLTWGRTEDVVDLLGAWYRAPGVDAADADVLVIAPTHNGGASYLWPGGRWLTGDGDTRSHDEMQRAVGVALGSYFRGADGDHAPAAYENFRFDVVQGEAGPALEAAMQRHYRFAELATRLPAGWRPRSLLVFPSGPEPIQALLARDCGLPAPLEISLARPLAPRPVRRVSVWAGGPWHEAFELLAIQRVAERAGWTLVVHQPPDPTVEDLRRFYEDADAEVLWVISHGTHDPFAVGGTGLHMPDETLVRLEVLEGWRTPADGRRLLVLNSCSGATAQGRGGLARIGLAQSLVGPAQAVVGNLWPVHWTAGLAFGAALAACLEDDPTEGAALTAMALLREPEALMAFLESRFSDCEDLLDRLRRSGEDLGSLTHWGCPVLLT